MEESKMKMNGILLVAALAGAMTTSVFADLLMTNGSIAQGSGRTVSGGNIAGGWTVFQPFTITDGAGWNVDTIGVDGWLVQDPMGLHMTGVLMPDDGAGNPDEANPIAHEVFNMTNTNAYASVWVDVTFDLYLAAGRYWMMWEDTGDPNYWAAIYPGTQGENSFSRNDAGNVYPADPTALRIYGTIPGPGALALLALAGLASRRRR
jgi:hypothetical protein